MKRCLSALSLFTAAALALAGCNKSQPTTEFKGKKDDYDHDHDDKDAKIVDVGSYHAGLTTHLPKKDGEPIELDVFFQTVKDKKPLPLAATPPPPPIKSFRVQMWMAAINLLSVATVSPAAR